MSDNPVEEDQQLGIPAERLESFRFPQDSPRTPSRAPPRALSRRASMVTFRKQLTEVPTKSATADGQLTTNLSLSGNPSPPASILESSSLLSQRPAPTVSTTAAVEEPSSGPSEKVDKEPVVVLPPSAVASNTPTSSRNGDGLQEQPTSPPPQQQQSLPLKESNTAAQTADHDASSSASHTPRLPVPVATPSPPPPPPSSGTPAEPPLSLSTSIAMPPVPNTSIVSPNLLSSNPSNLVDSMRSGGGGGGDDEQPHSAAAPLSARSLQSSSGNYHLDSSAAYGPILASPTNSVAAESREPSVAAPMANNENLLAPPTKTTTTPPSSASTEGTAAAAAAPATTVASSSPPLPPRVPRRHASSVILRRSPMVDAAASSDTSSPAAAATGSSGATAQQQPQQSQSRTASESPSRGRSGEAVSMYHDVPHVVSDSSNTASTLNTAAPSRSSSKSAAQRSAVPIASPSRDDFRFCDPLYVRSLSASSSTPGRFRYEPPAIIAATYQDALGTMIYCLSPHRSAAYVDPLQLQAYQNHHEGALEPVLPEEVKDEDYRTVDAAAPSSSLFLSPDRDTVLRQIPRLHLPSQQHGHPAQRNHNYSSLQEERSPPLLLTAAGAHASPSPYRSPSEGGGGYARQQSGARDTSSSGPRRTVSPFTDVSFGMGPPPQLTTPVGGTKGSVSPTFRMFKQRERAR